jgi:hypothetical protein
MASPGPQSFRPAGEEDADASGLHGITAIFDFYLDSINEKLARPEYLSFDDSDKLVQRATQKITELMAQKAVRWLPRDQAKSPLTLCCPDGSMTDPCFAI